MSPETPKSNKIRRIVKLRQMLLRWRLKSRPPSDVPAGHVAICVGTDFRRFIVRATFLNHPIFKKLLLQAEEEYGFHTLGPLALPCDESLFEQVLGVVSRSEIDQSWRDLNLDDFQIRRCDEEIRMNLGESRPLLNGYCDDSVF